MDVISNVVESVLFVPSHLFIYLTIYCSYQFDQGDGGEGLSPVFCEYIDGARQYLESDMDKEPLMLYDIRLHFTEFIRHLIRMTPGSLCKMNILHGKETDWAV